MKNVIRLRKGLDIPIKGIADGSLHAPVFSYEDYAVKPVDFWSMRPKLLVAEGDVIKAGTPLFYDKNREEIKVTSPVSGKVEQVVYGPKRRIDEIRIKADSKTEYEAFPSWTAEELSKWTKDDRGKATETLLNSGLWVFIHRRPYDTIPSPTHTPRDIFISCFDSAPLAIDMDVAAQGREADFQAGVDVLRTLTTGNVHLGLHVYKNSQATFSECARVELHHFDGPHPCGNVGVQIHHIAPISKGEEVWCVHPQDVMTIGSLFLNGKYDATKIIAVAGSEIICTGYHRILSGVSVKHFLADNVKGMERGVEHAGDKEPVKQTISKAEIENNIRVISGDVLSGTKIDSNGYIGAYDHLVTVIPEGNRYRFLGWITLGINMFSFSRTFFSWILRGKQYKIDTNFNGGNRAFVLTGEFEKVLPMDIYPLQLIKACIAKDIEAMENLGIYEVIPQDLALCEYIDVSKTEIQQIIRDGLELVRTEMGDE